MLDLPGDWEVVTHWPSTPSPQSDDDIIALLETPVGQPPIRELCRGKSRPLIIVDDLNRPTPAARIIPFVLRHLQDDDIPPERVTILVAAGTHGAPTADGVAKKVGPEAVSRCRVLVHDSRARSQKVGVTSAGTPVLVNPAVLAGDFLVGIGGVYPNYTAGFGGGAKLALGVLDRKSILHLHYAHRSMNGAYNADNSFRRDIAEIAAMIGLNTTISVHVDEGRNIVRLRCGDHRQYYSEAAAFSLETYQAPPPGDADVVIANTYPEDLSLLFARMKGFAPLRRAKPAASLVAIAGCTEGLGSHGLFPELARTPMTGARDLVRRLKVMPFGEIVRKASAKLMRNTGSTSPHENASDSAETAVVNHNPIWLYLSSPPQRPLPKVAPGMRITQSWAEILAAIRREQGDRKRLKVAIYPCAPLQCISDKHKEYAGNLQMEILTAQ